MRITVEVNEHTAAMKLILPQNLPMPLAVGFLEIAKQQLIASTAPGPEVLKPTPGQILAVNQKG